MDFIGIGALTNRRSGNHEAKCVIGIALAPLSRQPATPSAKVTYMQTETPTVINRIIASLPSKESRALLERCEKIELFIGDILNEAEEPFLHAYFPVSGCISLTKTLENHQPLEIVRIGSEGILGATLVLDTNACATKSTVQGSGEAMRITVPQLRELLSQCPVLLHTLKQYLYVLLTHMLQATVCINFHRLQPRLGRWLLMMHDRAHSDHFPSTHELLANMLGVRRSGITVAAGALQRRNLIRYSRGEIQILDRKGLENVSCDCYAEMVKSYALMLRA